MPQVNVESLPKNSVKLTITLSAEEMKPFIELATEHLNEHIEVPGFRKGKATLEALKRHVGEMGIYEEAVEQAVRKTFLEAIEANKIEPVGSPEIGVEKMAPGNDFVYTAIVALMPAIETLADYKTLKIPSKKIEAADKDVDLALKDIQRMQTKEVLAAAGSTATKDDKVVVNMNIKKDNIPLEGGQATNHAVYMAEVYYIKGFTDQLLGVKEGDQKSFKLKFPEEHYQKHLAGQEVEFEIDVKELFNLQPPTLDDAFAISLGQKDFATLKNLIKENLTNEKVEQETFRQEKEMLNLLAKESRFQDIPDLLVNEEINKMIDELKYSAEERGMVFEDYLKDVLKKTLADLKLDFTPQAINRIKVALILKEISRLENIKPTEEEINEEIDHLTEHYGENKEVKDRIYSPVYRDYLETVLTNKKVVEFLRKMMVES